KRGEVKKHLLCGDCFDPAPLLLLPRRPEIRLPVRLLAARGRGGCLDLVLLRFLGLAIAALLSLGHDVRLLWFRVRPRARLALQKSRARRRDTSARASEDRR